MTNTLDKIIHNGDEYEFPSGEVGVSDQANNIFTPGMKIWGGTESDYQSLTPDNNTAYLLLADQPTPPSPWQPGANTIAYFPLDTDLLDHSGNSFSVTQHGNVSIATVGDISAGDFTNLGDLVGSYTYNNTSLTALGWMYKTANPNADNASMFGFGAGNLGSPVLEPVYFNTDGPSEFSNKPGVMLFNYDPFEYISTGCIPMNNNEWVHFAATYDVSTRVCTLYVNGIQTGQYTSSTTNVINILGMSRRADTDRSWIGYMSNVIFEDKCWSAQEIADYFDQTKGDYGIS